MFLPWIDRYSIGDELIDNQHRKMLEMINTLHSALVHKGSTEVVRQVISQVVEYSREHFVAEEALMEKTNYPGLAVHRKLHAAMIKKLTMLLHRIKRGEEISVRELLAFLKSWWQDHIVTEDRKIGTWMNERQEVGTGG